MNLYEELTLLDTAEISDALDAYGVEGALLGIRPVVPGIKLIGPIFTVKYLPYTEKPASFQGAGNYIDEVPEGTVIFIDNQGREDCTTWGDVLTQVALLKNIRGTVVNGAVRDIEFIKKSNYSLYSKAVYMRTGKNRVFKAAHQVPLFVNGVHIQPHDILVGDDNGVVIIPRHLAEEVILKAKNIKITEEKILSLVKQGMRLDKAREKCNYSQPWLRIKNEQ